MENRLAKVDERNKRRLKSLSSLTYIKKEKYNERLKTVRTKSNMLKIWKDKKDESILIKAYSPKKLKPFQSVSTISTDDRISIVKNEAKKKDEEKQKLRNNRMAEFDAKSKRCKRRDRISAEERKELSHEWNETLKFVIKRKDKKEQYRREVISEKIKSTQKQQADFERNQRLYQKERFYTRMTTQMKDHYIQEAILKMAITKNWNANVINDLIKSFKPALGKGEVINERIIDQNINKVFNDPFTISTSSKWLYKS